MKSENVVVEKSFRFSIRIINLYRFLTNEKKEFVLSKQLLRCGTGIGANIEEAIGGQSERDFLSKISIAYKETRETIYWIKLLHATGFIDEKEMVSIMNDIEELARIIGKIQLTMKKKLNDP